MSKGPGHRDEEGLGYGRLPASTRVKAGWSGNSTGSVTHPLNSATNE
jgi:hypothetical protein